MNFKITFSFFKYLPNAKKFIHKESIEGNSVMDCSRKAFDVKMKLQSKYGGEVIYKKDEVKRKKIRKKQIEERVVKSKDYSAEDAIEYIKNNDDIENFLSIDEDRVTVINAFNKKQNT